MSAGFFGGFFPSLCSNWRTHYWQKLPEYSHFCSESRGWWGKWRMCENALCASPLPTFNGATCGGSWKSRRQGGRNETLNAGWVGTNSLPARLFLPAVQTFPYHWSQWAHLPFSRDWPLLHCTINGIFNRLLENWPIHKNWYFILRLTARLLFRSPPDLRSQC